jgi:hypothetical protein
VTAVFSGAATVTLTVNNTTSTTYYFTITEGTTVSTVASLLTGAYRTQPQPVTGSTLLVYDGNNATSGTVPASVTVGSSGGSVTIPENTGNLVKTGYSFAGWNAEADGSGITYQKGLSYWLYPGTLYALWE